MSALLVVGALLVGALLVGALLVGGLVASPQARAATDFGCDPARPSAAQRSPYQADSPFRAVLEDTKYLQAPLSGPCLRDDRGGDGVRSDRILPDHYYLNAADELVVDFRAGVKSDRLELRGSSFPADTTGRHLTFSYTVPGPAGQPRSDGFTIGQVFSKTEGAPMLRLEVMGERDGDQNQLVAVWKTPDGESVFRSLGPVADADGDEPLVGDVDVTYGAPGDTIEISHRSGRSVAVQRFSLGDWALPDKEVYFKSGCYLQDAGDCRVHFEALSFDGNGAASPAPTPPSAPPAADGCTAEYRVLGRWRTGYRAEVTVRAGTDAVSGWTVDWRGEGAIRNAWGADVDTEGATVTAGNVNYNGDLAGGGTTTFGVVGTGPSGVESVGCVAR